MALPIWRYKRFHSSQLLAWLAAGVLVGLLVGRIVAPSLWLWLAVGVVVLAWLVSLRAARWVAVILAVAAGLGLGMLRGTVFFEDWQQLETYRGQTLTLQGTISQDPVLTNGSNLWQVALHRIQIGSKTMPGEVYATVQSDETLKRGDKLTVQGKAVEGFGNFGLAFYRVHLEHAVRENDVFLATRDTFADGMRRVVPEPEASLGLGFLVGQKSALPDDLTEQLKTVGLTHIVVASGYNLTILVRFVRRLLARRSRYLAFMGSCLLVSGFVLVSGFGPSLNRAAIVTFLSLVTWYFGRKFHPVKLILYVAAATALFYPPYVWGDLGWLLSFAAFTGVLVLAPIVTQAWYGRDKKPGAFVQLMVETFAAELMTLPIILVAFAYVPVLAFVANALVGLVLPFAMLATFVAGMVGLIAPALSVLALPASIVIAYVVAVVEKLASPDWARFATLFPWWGAALWYSVLALLAVMIWKKRRVDLFETSVIE